jgi:hypothetical protein
MYTINASKYSKHGRRTLPVLSALRNEYGFQGRPSKLVFGTMSIYRYLWVLRLAPFVVSHQNNFPFQEQ